MRITVSDVLEYLAADRSEQQVLNDFPELTSEGIHACLAFAADTHPRIAGQLSWSAACEAQAQSCAGSKSLSLRILTSRRSGFPARRGPGRESRKPIQHTLGRLGRGELRPDASGADGCRTVRMGGREVLGGRASAERFDWVRGLPFYYGWIIVFLGAFSMFATTPGQSDSFSLFMDSFVSEFGWSRTVVSSLYSGATLLSGCVMFFVGRLVDRLGAKAVVIASGLMLGIACLLLSLSISPFMLFAGFFLARLTGKGALDLSASTLAPQWFIRRRAFAIMLVGLGGTIGGALFPLLNSWLIGTFGWRTAYRFLAGGLWLVYVPVVWVFLVNRPEDVGMKPDNVSVSEAPATRERPIPGRTIDEPSFRQPEAIRTSAFWILTYVVFQSSLVGTGVILHFVSILGAHGYSMTFAAVVMGIKPLVALSTTILAGLVLDRIRKHHWVLGAACLLQVASFLNLAFLRSSAMAYLFAVIGGIGSGLLLISYRVLKPNLFGRRYLGGILGVTAAFNVIGSAIGPIAFGAAYDRLHGYQEIILLMSTLPLLGAILSFLVRRPSLPAVPDASSS